MVVIDWLQTSEFIRRKTFPRDFSNKEDLLLLDLENSERFVLYSLCGCFLGIAIILIAIVVLLYIEKRRKISAEDATTKTDYQTPRTDFEDNDLLSGTRSYIPIYRYNGRTENGFYHV